MIILEVVFVLCIIGLFISVQVYRFTRFEITMLKVRTSLLNNLEELLDPNKSYPFDKQLISLVKEEYKRYEFKKMFFLYKFKKYKLSDLIFAFYPNTLKYFKFCNYTAEISVLQNALDNDTFFGTLKEIVFSKEKEE